MRAHPSLEPFGEAAAVLVPCTVVVVAVVADVAWWLAVVAVAAALAVFARLAGRSRGAVAAMVATPAVVLVIERQGSGPLPIQAAELGAMAVFLLVAVTAGRPTPPEQ